MSENVREQDLRVEVTEDGRLVVSVGVDTLKFAFEHHPDNKNGEV